MNRHFPDFRSTEASVPASGQRTVLLVGAGPEQVPLITVAKRLGLRVLVTDRDPTAPGRSAADEFACISTADREGTARYAREEQVDGIASMCSETAVPVVAHAAASLGLPGISERTAYLATNKCAMHEALAAAGVPLPTAQSVSDTSSVAAFVETNGLPVVIKPSDNSGARGITLVRDRTSLDEAFVEARRYATDGAVFVQAFVPGPEISVTAVVESGKLTCLDMNDRFCDAKYFGIALEHLSPPSLSQPMRESLLAACQRAVDAIGLDHGMASVQAIAGPAGPRVVEIQARVLGGHLRDVGLLRSGNDPAELTLRYAMGMAVTLNGGPGITRWPAAAVRFLTVIDFPGFNDLLGAVCGLEEAREMPGVIECEVTARLGKPLPSLASTTARFGAVVTVGASRKEAHARAAAAAAKITVR